MLIDTYCHILPPKYLSERNKRAGKAYQSQYAKYPTANPGLTDLDVRFRIMDKFPGLKHILTIAGPNVESITKPRDTADLCRIANDELAELVNKYPDRFVAAIACLPMNDMDEALKEAERAIDELRFRGVEIFTDIDGKPVDAKEFLPLYEMMQGYNLPVLLHPRRPNTRPDYAGEDHSLFLVYTNFGWPYETSVAMARLAFNVLTQYPDLKVLTHHAGGMIPFFSKRIQLSWDFNEMRMGYRYDGRKLAEAPLDYYRKFFCDTAIQGNPTALMCAREFFGIEHMMFATDMPYDNTLGERVYHETIDAVESMDISEKEKQMIYCENARKFFRLPI